MEVFWIYPWLVFIGKWPALTVQKTPLSLLSVIFLLVVSFITTRLFLSRKWSLLWIQMSIITFGLVAIFLVVRIEYSAGFKLLSSQWFTSYGNIIIASFSHPNPFVFALPIGFYLWWRGISLSRSSLYFANIYSSFLSGLAALVLLIIMWGISLKAEPLQNLTSDIGIYIAGFFFFSLISLALSNLRNIQERMKAKGESSKIFGRRWLSIIISLIGGIVLIGVGFASIFTTQFISTLGRIMSSVSDVLYKVLYYVFLPLGYLVELLYYIGKFIINWLRQGQPLEPFKFSIAGNPDDLPEVTKGVISPQVILILKLTILALVLLGVLFLLTRAVTRRRSTRAQDEVDEEQESLWSWEEFKSDVMILFKAFFQLFRRKSKPVSESTSLNWQGDEDIKRRLSIREIYQHLLWQAARLRIPRESYETPFEYARRLGQVVPDGKEPLNEITRLYIDVRYGEHQMEDKKIDDANSIWEKLRNLLKRLEDN
jgi:hypothetical protein